MNNLGIYIHIPFCLKKCRYCDFVSFPGCSVKEMDEYSYFICDKIESEAVKYARDYIVDSVFFGGGTPTCMPSDMIVRILLCIKKNFKLSDDAEISIEANPETVSLEKFKILRYHGFNRVSMGVQSFNDEVLSFMGRVHNSEKALDSFMILRKAGFDNINLDLMLGVPKQNSDIWMDSIKQALALSPEHLSFYSLQLEEGTPFYEDYASGRMDIPSWEENRRMYWYAVEALKSAGYHHYEISNAAKPGFECRHNLKYWTMKPYLGIGKSAHSFIDGKRWSDEDEEIAELSSEKELEGDWIFTGLRLVDGTDFGADFCNKYEEIISDLVEKGLIIKEENRLRFTKKGMDNTNNVISLFLN